MQHIKQIKTGLSIFDITHRLSHGCCCAQNLHAVKSTAQEHKDGPLVTRHTRGKLVNNKSTNTNTSSSTADAVDVASTLRSTKVDFVDASRRCIGGAILSWKKKKNYSSSTFSADDDHQQFGSTQQWRTSSTNSANHIRNFSSTDNTVDLQQPGDQQRSSKSSDASKLSGSSALGQKDPKPMPEPPDPETCCESGCVNCVWIRYVQELMEHSPDDKEQIKKVLDLIEDYNVKMFVKMELDL